MPIAGGGPGDKVGNRYELRWTVRCMLDVLAHRAWRIWLEPPAESGEGIELKLTTPHQVECHQVKLGNQGGAWHLSALRNKGILRAFATHLQYNTLCVFVSMQAAPELQELHNRALQFTTWPEFEGAALKAKRWRKHFDFLGKAWGMTPQRTYGLLKNVKIETLSEDALAERNRIEIAQLFKGKPDNVADVLAQFALNSIHQDLSAEDIRRHLAARGFQSLTTPPEKLSGILPSKYTTDDVGLDTSKAAASEGARTGSVQATAIFLSIVRLASMDGPKAHATISALHAVLRKGLLAPRRIPGLRVLSCLTGAIVLVPDDAHVEVVDLFAVVARDLMDAGLAVYTGVAHGPVELLEDADETLNAVGVCLNVAARLANAQVNPGLLVHESYADHVAGILPNEHWLHPAKRSTVEAPGKRQEIFRCFAAPPEAIPIRTDCSIACATPPPVFVNAVLVAYDLPGFSDGNARQLASRFRSVVQEVRRMRDSGAILPQACFSFSPGGDGAILALTSYPLDLAYDLAQKLEYLLESETEQKASGASVRARIGVHYGPVLLYESAEGTQRPTGPTLFDAILKQLQDLRLTPAVLINLAACHETIGDQERARMCYEQARDIVHATGNKPVETLLLGKLGLVLIELGDAQQGKRLCEQALTKARDSGNARAEGTALGNLGRAYHLEGDNARAIDYYEGALRIATALKDERRQASWLTNLANMYRETGDLHRALSLYEEALATLGDAIADAPYLRGLITWNMGLTHERLGEDLRAIELMQHRVDHERAIGHRDAETHAEHIETLRRRMGKSVLADPA